MLRRSWVRRFLLQRQFPRKRVDNRNPRAEWLAWGSDYTLSLVLSRVLPAFGEGSPRVVQVGPGRFEPVGHRSLDTFSQPQALGVDRRWSRQGLPPVFLLELVPQPPEHVLQLPSSRLSHCRDCLLR